MPAVSKRQMRFMAVHAFGKPKGGKKGGPSRKVAREFLAKSRGAYKRLPERVSKRTRPSRRTRSR